MKEKLFIILCAACIALSTSCASISVKHDDFNDSTVVTLKEYYYFKGGVHDFTYVTYTNEIKDGKNNVKMSLKYETNKFNSKKGFAEKAIVKVDGQQYDLQLNGGNKSTKITAEGETRGRYDDHGSTPRYRGKTTITTEAKDTFTGWISVTPEIFNKWKSAKSVSFRLFMDEQPLTIVFSKSSLEKLKEFANTTGK